MQTKEIKGKNREELEKLLDEKREGLRKFRFGNAGSKIKNVKEGGNIKKDIARVLTELRAQELVK